MEEKRKRLTNAITGDRKGQEGHSLSESTRTLIILEESKLSEARIWERKGISGVSGARIVNA